MNLAEAFTLAGILLVLAAIPSASVALVVARSMSLGVGNGIAVAVGIVIGDLIFIALAIFGLAFVANYLGSFFIVVKMIGGLYLIWLGVSLLRTKPAVQSVSTIEQAPRNLWASLIAGLALTMGDIKAIVFYASLFPAFVDLAAVSAFDILLIVIITVVCVGGVKVVYACLASRLAELTKARKFGSITTRVAGLAVIVAGSVLIFNA